MHVHQQEEMVGGVELAEAAGFWRDKNSDQARRRALGVAQQLKVESETSFRHVFVKHEAPAVARVVSGRLCSRPRLGPWEMGDL
jgi:hypothetical protein